MKFGRLTAMERVPHYRKNGQSAWLCRCECGVSRLVDMSALTSGKTKSCGCLYRDAILKRIEAGDHPGLKHGMTKTTEYRIWVGMKKRCYFPGIPGYRLYGARGITVCDRWLESFENFYADMGPRPKGKTLDRKNNDGPYSPENCHWATNEEQQNNRRACVYIECFGKRLTMAQWSRERDMWIGTIRNRMKRGLSPEEILA
jgi:hypothetical protein